ncbi:protein YoaL [Enterobacteriaceae bacterium C23F]
MDRHRRQFPLRHAVATCSPLLYRTEIVTSVFDKAMTGFALSRSYSWNC